MAIGIIGWGSLIWAPKSLRLGSRWFTDGPVLPLEFARISRADRATLVITEHGVPQKTYWALAFSSNLDTVIEEMVVREGSQLIYHARADGYVARGCPDEIGSTMTEWLLSHSQLEACVWTGLGSNWLKKRGQEFSVEDGLAYLMTLKDATEAKAYIEMAPAQIQTPLRVQVRKKLGWLDAKLDHDLFAEV